MKQTLSAALASLLISTAQAATVPGIPSIGVATPGNGMVTITGSAPPASDGGSPILTYNIAGSWGVNLTVPASAISSPIVVTGLSNGTPYQFSIAATNAMGTGSPSAASNTVDPAVPPGTPAIASVVAGDGQVTVNVVPSYNMGGSPYIVLNVISTPGNKIQTLMETTNVPWPAALVVTGLTNGTAYYFQVSTSNNVGISSISPPSVLVTPLAATVPGAPTIGTATASNAQATVSFSPPASDGRSPITKYTVTSSPGSKTATGLGSPITVTGLTNGTSYTFKVTATNAKGTGPASAASNSVKPAPIAPGAPTIGTATGGNAQASVAFTAPASNGGSAITKYTATSSLGGLTGTGTKSPIVVTGLTNGTTYTFTVTATNAVGTGPASTASNSVTPATVPGAPIIGTATAGNAQANINFTAPASNGGSPITSYTATSTPGNFTGTGTTSPITVTGLTNGTAYTLTVTATNAKGTGAASAASNSVTPILLTNAMTLYFIETDHLQTPRRIADANDTTVWTWDNAEPFGNSTPTAPGGFTYNPRFAGQYADAESNLYHNGFRQFDPATGRYEQADHVGTVLFEDMAVRDFGPAQMMAGRLLHKLYRMRPTANLSFAYGNVSPLNTVDPSGLDPWATEGRGIVYTDMTNGWTGFFDAWSGESLKVPSSNAVASSAQAGANDPYSALVTYCELGQLAASYGTAKLRTNDPRSRWVHGGGSGVSNPWAPQQGWKPTEGCTRAQNSDVESICAKVGKFKQKYPDGILGYRRDY